MKKLHLEILLIIMVALWGLSFSMTKPLLSKVGVFNFLAYRFIIGGILLTILLYFKKKIKFDQETVKAGVTTGVLLFIAFYCHVEGLKYTSIAKNSFIVGSSVVFIPIILLIAYKAKSSVMVLVQTVITIIGLALITLVNAKANLNYGDVITLIGTVTYAFYTVIVEKAVRKLNVSTFTAIQLCTVGIFSLIATLLFEEFVYDFTPVEWINIAFLAVVLTGLSYYLLGQIQRELSASNVSMIFTLEPFFATLFAWLFMKEYVGINTIFGGLLIFTAVLIPYLKFKKRTTKLGLEGGVYE